MGIIKDSGAGPVCLDTCVFIYFIEENKTYIDVVESIFTAIDEGRISAVTSGITLLETLVIPLRTKDIMLADKYEELLSESQGLTLAPLDKDLLRKAADLRAPLGLKTPDALQIALLCRQTAVPSLRMTAACRKLPDLKSCSCPIIFEK